VGVTADEKLVGSSRQSEPKTILIVEDNELNMKLFHDLLSAYGYKVLQAFEGISGLQMAQQHRPDLIIMDVQLPGTLSGLDVTRSLKQADEFRSILVVAVTAFAMKGDEDKIREAGCDGYITKPIAVKDFLAAVREYLR
jgi:two-component system, cell cycle response regulator DivK